MSARELPPFVDPREFPFEPRIVRLSSGEGLSVVDLPGEGAPIVFSHGTPTWSYEFRKVARSLAGRHRVILVDHLGFGLSERPPEADYRPEAHARRFEDLIGVLGIPSFHLVVHDFGGPFALPTALGAPERIRSLTLANTFAWGFGDSGRTRFLAWLASTAFFGFLYRRLNFSFVIAKSAWGKSSKKGIFEVYERFFPDPDSRGLVLFPLARSMKGSREFCESIWESRERLARVPMHVLWGMRDSAFPPTALARLVRAFPHAEVTRLDDAGHFPFEEAPFACLSAIERLVELSESLFAAGRTSR